MRTPHPLADVDRPVTRAEESAASAAHWLAHPISDAEKPPTLAQRWATEPEWPADVEPIWED
jgi:hypothetical protein